jgi:uncharacterized protein Veg
MSRGAQGRLERQTSKLKALSSTYASHFMISVCASEPKTKTQRLSQFFLRLSQVGLLVLKHGQ